MKSRVGFALAAFVVALLAAPRFAVAPQSPHDWGREFRQVLDDNILKFWLDHAVDRTDGGMIGWLSREGKPIPPGTKSLVQQARVLWTFSAAYQFGHNPAYRDAATHELRFMREKMWDRQRGGFNWIVERDGRVKDARKHLYGQSFAIYGLAEYARVFGDKSARQEALELFELIDRQAHDSVNGGYHEQFDEDWRPAPNNLLALGGRAPKSMNTHIHLLESLTTLYRATGDARVKTRVEEVLNLCVTKIVDSKQGYARLYFTDDWTPVEPGTSSYGHDIELSWLLTEAAEALGRPGDPRVHEVSLALVEHTLRDAWDHEQGGFFNEGPVAGPPARREKVWWVEAEALVGLLNAYQSTGKQEYRQRFDQQARYVLEHFVDREYGDWFNTIEPDGRIGGNKTDEWKGPYHQGRACMEIMRRWGGLGRKSE